MGIGGYGRLVSGLGRKPSTWSPSALMWPSLAAAPPNNLSTCRNRSVTIMTLLVFFLSLGCHFFLLMVSLPVQNISTCFFLQFSNSFQ